MTAADLSIDRAPRVRLDVLCNDPDNGIFANRAEAIQVSTWDGELIELPGVRRAPRFTEIDGGIRFLRRRWPVLGSIKWYGNWCWNAYFLHPDVILDLLALAHGSGLFHCDCAPSALYDNWNDDSVFARDVWAANLLGRHSIGAVA